MKGRVTERKSNYLGQGYQYTIQSDDSGINYFTHVGDLNKNEWLVYLDQRRADLNIGDIVEFNPIDDQQRAIHVKKITQ